MSDFDLMLVLCLSVTLICFIGLILVLFFLYYKSKKKNYENGLENEALSREMEKDKRKNGCGDYEGYRTIHRKKKKAGKASGVFGVLVNALVAIIFLGALSFSIVMNVNSNELSIQTNRLLIIKTSSMSTKNSNNSYLDMESNKNAYRDTRIAPYTLIALDEYKDKSQIELYDIVAFKIDDTLIVHRVIQIDEKDGITTFTFRGDSNPYSMKDEIGVGEDRIVGVYNGFQSTPLGYVIGYMQSTIGIISVCFLVVAIMGYTILYEKLDKEHDKAYERLLDEKVKEEIVVEIPPRQSDIYVRLIRHN